MSTIARRRQVRRRIGEGRDFVLAFSMSWGVEDVVFVVSSSSTHAMSMKGNWKKDERHISKVRGGLRLLDSIDAEDSEELVYVEEDEEHAVR
jgi:hypothetical protein